MINDRIDIACLPVAGDMNPYQNLMIEGLNESKLINAFNGIDDRFFGIIRTYLKYKPNYLHFDWLTAYYFRRTLWMTYLLLPIFALQILYIKFFTKTKFVWTLHEIYPHDADNIKLHKRIRMFFAQQCQWIRVFSDETIPKAAKELNVLEDKFITLPEGDYCSIYPNKISYEDARKRLYIDNKCKTYLYLGFIKPYKGIEKLIYEFNKLKHQNIKLIIAGQGIDKNYSNKIIQKVERLNDNRISLIDTFISVDDLQIYFNAADLVVLPFVKVENSGSAIMAMGFGKPILAPKIGVLKKRLSQQEKLLYNSLEEGLNKSLTYKREELVYIGELNFSALQKYKWSDYGSFFEINK